LRRWRHEGPTDPLLVFCVAALVGTASVIGLYGAVGFAALDSLSSGLQHGWNAALVDFVMYSESLTLALAFDDIVKIAVRRPRPSDYAPENANNTTNTDLALTFFSGHAAMVAAMSGTATYLAFVHSPRAPRTWITLAAGTLLTAFVGYERVRAGVHFPTDIMMGGLAGAAIGVLVPHLHRTRSASAPIWIDLAPASRGTGASLGVHGLF
jgi:undecaprenyl-diphosphatase